MTTAQDGGRLSAPAAFTLRKYSWYSFILEAESTPGPYYDRKDFMSMKNPLTPAGIEPATFRFVAQHLNHCATAVPNLILYFSKTLGLSNLLFNRYKRVFPQGWRDLNVKLANRFLLELKLKNEWSYVSTALYYIMFHYGLHEDIFTFTFTFTQ